MSHVQSCRITWITERRRKNSRKTGQIIREIIPSFVIHQAFHHVWTLNVIS